MAGVAGLTFCHEEQEDLLWVKTIVFVVGIHLDKSIGLCGQLQKTGLVTNPMQLNLCEQPEVIALLFGSVVNPNILSLQPPSTGTLLLFKMNIVILIIKKEQPSNTELFGDLPHKQQKELCDGHCCSRFSQGNLVDATNGPCHEHINGSHGGDSPHCRRGSMETDSHEAPQIVTKPDIGGAKVH
jgi:hypothetical protein